MAKETKGKGIRAKETKAKALITRVLGTCFLTCCLLLSACGTVEEIDSQNTGTTEQKTAESEETKNETVESEATGQVPTEEIIEEPVELLVYSQVSSYIGEQQGWFARIMLEKFNVKLQYVSDPGVFDERERLGDIVIIGNYGDTYKDAVKEGKLLDWETDDLLAEHGTYILENMAKALENNRNLTLESGKIYGIGDSVADSIDTCEEFFYTWDIRWDLYSQLGYPEMHNLEDLVAVFEEMKELCPVDDNGEETYAMSLWSDWDTNMVMNVKCLASAYYGYDELGLGLYDSETGTFYGALEENGPYLTMLKFLNTLNQKGLLDSNSETLTYQDATQKMDNGGVFFSVFDYAGSEIYNTEKHMAENKYMASLLPEAASPVNYGLSISGGDKIWAIGADTEYPELCMEIINWLCTPEGRMVSTYGPRGITWDYDENGNTYFTDFGKKCMENPAILMVGVDEGTYFSDGYPQMNNITWSSYAKNPDSNGETYHYASWKSNVSEAICEAQQNWRDYTGMLTTEQYLRSQEYVIVPATDYEAPERSAELEAKWQQVAACIVEGSWDAIFAKSDSEFEKIVEEMISDAVNLGYEDCMTWCELEAEKRHEAEETMRK